MTLKQMYNNRNEKALYASSIYLFKQLKECQRILAKNLPPDSGKHDSDTVNELLSVLDSQKLVRRMKELSDEE